MKIKPCSTTNFEAWCPYARISYYDNGRFPWPTDIANSSAKQKILNNLNLKNNPALTMEGSTFSELVRNFFKSWSTNSNTKTNFPLWWITSCNLFFFFFFLNKSKICVLHNVRMLQFFQKRDFSDGCAGNSFVFGD